MKKQTDLKKAPRTWPASEFLRVYLNLTVRAKTNRAYEIEKPSDDEKWEVWRACRELAEEPNNQLAALIASPVIALARLINDLLLKTEVGLRSKSLSTEQIERIKKLSDQLDFSLAVIYHNLGHLISGRGKHTQNSDLFAEALVKAEGDGAGMARLIRRCRDSFPDEITSGSENIVDSFAWETYQRVEELDRLADEFPEQISTAAARMHGWPMIRQRHHDNRARFEELANKFNLGAEYPLDTSKNARFRADTPMVRYLDPLVCHLNYIRQMARNEKHLSVEQQNRSLRALWGEGSDDPLNEEALAVLRVAHTLPQLTKASAAQWTRKGIVPLIISTDARDYKKCKEPALQQIAKQRGVKSLATFKSRLSAAIIPTLTSMARPG